jgi:hypothetical protein
LTRPKISIALLMIVVLLIAVAFSALTNPNEVWTTAVYTLVVGALATSVLEAAATRGRTRLGWVGFALFGWIYLALSLWPGFGLRIFAPFMLGQAGARVPFVSELFFDLFRPPGQDGAQEFAIISHSLTALVAGALGMAVARVLAVWNGWPPEGDDRPPEP